MTVANELQTALESMTPAELAEYDKLLTGLREYGYTDMPVYEAERKTLRPGTRVRHNGERWDAALFDGTGVVLAITEKPDSTWSMKYRARDIELIMLRDKPVYPRGSRLSQLAQYHVDTPFRVGESGD